MAHFCTFASFLRQHQDPSKERKNTESYAFLHRQPKIQKLSDIIKFFFLHEDDLYLSNNKTYTLKGFFLCK